MTTNNKEDFSTYLQSAAYGAMSFQQWLAQKAFAAGLFDFDDLLQFQRELKGGTE